MEIQVNGEVDRLPGGATVADLVSSKGLRTDQVAVEVNREIVPRARHAATLLQGGDRVEIVTLVGGG
ncbi:MAG: sulfur carrier protein ThiS [Planctomycetota bacterium]